jgi:type IV pilus assembly protein PilB
MSEPSQQIRPDLDEMLGLSAASDQEPVISIERATAGPELDAAAIAAAEAAAIEEDEGLRIELQPEDGPVFFALDDPAGDGYDSEEPFNAEDFSGITRALAKGSNQRLMTDVLVEMGFVTREQVEEALRLSSASGETPENVLLEQGAVTHDVISRALAERYGLDYIDLGLFVVDMAAANLVSTAVAKRYQAVPVSLINKRTLLVAMADPSNVLAVDDIAIMTGYEVRVAVAPPDDIAALISRLDRLEDVVGEPEEEEEETVQLHDSAEDAPVVKLVNQIVAQGVERGASDIHLAPDGTETRVRFRVDGILHDITTVPKRLSAGVVSRIKIMAELNIAERRLPQDGRVGLVVDGRHVDLRVVTLPSVNGEGVVMRVLDKGSVVVELDKLGMADPERLRLEAACSETHGAVLVTGPTGSGKSTTLYAALKLLNTPEKNIITVEDPVEYEMAGLTQVQVAAKVGLTFAMGLRAMVRADPDVIMVGEIRDRETAQIAVESALTGHLVLSTLHTNDAPSAITRLIEMGIEPFLVASSLDCIVAQRLARMLCPQCKRPTTVPAKTLQESGYKAEADMDAYEPVGCRRCGGTGYRGRLGLYEVMRMSPEIQALTLERAPAEKIRDVAIAQGMTGLRDDGVQKVGEGRTSMAEIVRVVGGGS